MNHPLQQPNQQPNHPSNPLPVFLEFHGAAGEVTGSRTVLRVGGNHGDAANTARIMVDCGLFQGGSDSRAQNWEPTRPRPADVSAVVLTHAHLDHSGRLPRYCREGFSGPIYCTDGTAELGKILLLDAAFLEEEQAAWARRTGYSRHKNPLPLFTEADANAAIDHFKVVPRNEWHALGDNISFQFLRGGHITGASLVQFAIESGGESKLVTFSGDLGNERSLTMRPPVDLVETDILVLESTYGSRVQARQPALEMLGQIISRTLARQGVVVIPAFAVGRTQEILYMIRLLEDKKTIPQVPVILDSPMATAATRTFLRHTEDHQLATSFNGGTDGFLPKYFETTHSTDESMAACMREGPMIIISASGMLNGGRILHHLKTRLPDPANTVVFVGYQAEGTKGRYLLDHGKAEGKLRIFHAEVPVEADIESVDNLSAHADQQDLVAWVGRMRKLPKKILLNHGSQESSAALAGLLKSAFPGSEILPVHTQGEIRIF